MISNKMAERINVQVNREMYSAYLYMAMSARMTEAGYTGIGKWLMVQYHEEMFHAMKFIKYLEEQGASLKLATINVDNLQESSVKDIFERVYAHERGVTASIKEIMDLAVEEKDYATQGFIAWFIDEQIEEERNVRDILQSLEIMGNNQQALYMMNVELGKRGLTAPTDFSIL